MDLNEDLDDNTSSEFVPGIHMYMNYDVYLLYSAHMYMNEIIQMYFIFHLRT